MRLTSTGLGIGTSSPGSKLQVANSGAVNTYATVSNSLATAYYGVDASGNAYCWNGGAYSLLFGTSGTQRMTLDSSGNLGLGVTPSAWGGAVAMQVQRGSINSYASLDLQVSQNSYYDGSGYKYIASSFATTYSQYNGQHIWRTAPSGTAGNAISFTQAMTLDASGNLGVGTTSPAWKLDVDGIIASRSGSLSGLRFQTAANGYNGFVLYETSSNSIIVNNYNAGPITFKTSDTERARIDSSGNLLVGTTSAGGVGFSLTNNAGAVCTTTQRASGTGATNMCLYVNPNGTVGTIQISGTSTSYNTSSDYRLKEDIQPMTGALAKVAALKPCTYKWKADGSDGEGFIAHELAEVVPQCVTGEKDAVDTEGKPVYQGIDTSFLVATLTAAIQELKASLDEVKLEFDAYKATHP